MKPKSNWLCGWMVLITLIIVSWIVFGCFCCARAQEIPDWDKVIPIIIKIESNGNPNAVSEDGCIGLMQISPIVLKEYNADRLFQKAKENKNSPSYGVAMVYGDNHFWDICTYENYHLFVEDINVEIGTWYLKRIWFHYLPHYKIPQTVENMLIAYNWGIGNLVKYIREPNKTLPKETKRYIAKYHTLAGRE